MAAPEPRTTALPRWLTSKTPTDSRTAACSLRTPPSAYSSGISQPPNGANFAPRETCRSCNGDRRRAADVGSSRSAMSATYRPPSDRPAAVAAQPAVAGPVDPRRVARTSLRALKRGRRGQHQPAVDGSDPEPGRRDRDRRREADQGQGTQGP